jgi:hypothetical protein
VGLALGAALATRVARVPDDEMAPSLFAGDWVVLAPGTPTAGEVVALVDPLDPSRWTLRRVEAIVEVDGKDRVMVFITNNVAWSARSVGDLYRARWEIEVFFKQVKQTLKLSGFVGYSANAIRWQVWTALLVYVLLRFAAHLSQWAHSFTRVFAVVRAAMWERLDLLGLLRSYGTAGGSFRMLGAVHTSWLPGFGPQTM